MVPPRDGVAQAWYCAPDGCGRSAAWKKSSRRGPFRAAPVAREAGPARSPVAAQMSQRWALSHDADSEATKAPICDSTSTTRRLAPIARTSQKMSGPKCLPIASKLVTESQTRRNNKPKRHGGWGTAMSREWMNHALASWLPCCAATRTSSRQGAMRTQRLPYTLRKPTDSREGIGACVACGQCPVEGKGLGFRACASMALCLP